MVWIKSPKYPSGMTMWEPKPTPDFYKDITIHVFNETEGYTVSFERHQVSRFKTLEDATKFADDLIISKKQLEDAAAEKEARKSKRSKKNVNDMDNI